MTATRRNPLLAAPRCGGAIRGSQARSNLQGPPGLKHSGKEEVRRSSALRPFFCPWSQACAKRAPMLVRRALAPAFRPGCLKPPRLPVRSRVTFCTRAGPHPYYIALGLPKDATKEQVQAVNRALYLASFGMLCFQLPLWAIGIRARWEPASNRGLEDELAEIAASAIHDKSINFSHAKELTTALEDMWAEEKEKAYASAKKGVTGDYYFVFVSTLGASVEDVEMLMPTELVDMKARGRLSVHRGGRPYEAEYRFTIRIKEKSDLILKRLEEEHGEHKKGASGGAASCSPHAQSGGESCSRPDDTTQESCPRRESGAGGHMASEVAMLRALAGSEHNTGTYTGCTQAPRSVLAVEKA